MTKKEEEKSLGYGLPGRQFGCPLVLLDVGEDGLKGFHPGLPVVDAQGLPVEQVREALSSVPLNDALATIQSGKVMHVAGKRETHTHK